MKNINICVKVKVEISARHGDFKKSFKQIFSVVSDILYAVLYPSCALSSQIRV